jgi:DNA-binding NtrC family response regulator
MTDDLVLEPWHFGADEVGAAPAPPRPAPEPAPAAAARREGAPPALLRPLADQVADLERQAIRTALMATSGNRVAAARLLKMSRAALYDRLERWPELAG